MLDAHKRHLMLDEADIVAPCLIMGAAANPFGVGAQPRGKWHRMCQCGTVQHGRDFTVLRDLTPFQLLAWHLLMGCTPGAYVALPLEKGYSMKKSISGWLGLAVLAGWSLMGCAGGGGADQSEETSEVGKLALPLVTNGPSGTQYQLRNATFQIQSTRYYYGVGGSNGKGGAVAMGGAMPVTGGATSVSVPAPIIVSSETNPTEPTIEVDLEQGDYRVVLLPGWSLESVVDGVSTPVPEVQLISGETQWVWVSPRSTSWVSYQFGLGGRNVWFNGKLNIEMQVYETPDDYYGPGYGGSSGATWVPAGGVPTTIPAAGGAYGL